MAVVLGSDVPFFLTGGTAFVSGRGEIAEPVKSPADLWVVLAKPPFFSDTASAFRLLDRARERGIKTEAGDDLPREGLIRALEGEPGSWPFRNDFLPVFLDPAGSGDTGSLFMERAGIYRALLETLRNAGASFTGLSGSGSACFGIFTVKEKAQTAEKTLFGKGNFTKLTFFLALRPDPVLE
jgi:4-diphosphocytidyl-2-C-methyl-D-erythritol kinase